MNNENLGLNAKRNMIMKYYPSMNISANSIADFGGANANLTSA